MARLRHGTRHVLPHAHGVGVIESSVTLLFGPPYRTDIGPNHADGASNGTCHTELLYGTLPDGTPFIEPQSDCGL